MTFAVIGQQTSISDKEPPDRPYLLGGSFPQMALFMDGVTSWIDPPMDARRWRRSTPHVVAAALGVVVAVIFVLDTLTDREIAISVLYVAVILLASRTLRRRLIIAFSAACMTATVLSLALTGKGAANAGIVNSALSVLAIGATTYLSLSSQAAAAAEQRLRARLAMATRTAAVSELGAAIAHEVNQPLAAISAHGNAGLHWLAAQPPNIERALSSLSGIVADATRAGEIVNRIRALATGSAARLEPISLNYIVREAVRLHAEIAHTSRTKLDMHLDAALPNIVGDRVQLTQVASNLIANAIDAVKERPEGARQVSVATRNNGSNGIALMVSDNGPGILAALQDRVFDPFYSTKPGGMGLGLAITRTFVEAHRGELKVEANQPAGARFTVSLPLNADQKKRSVP